MGILARNCSTIIAEKRPLPGSLEALSKQTSTKKLATVLSLIAAELRKGNTLGSAFQKQQHHVGPFFSQIVAHGEAGGNLGPLLTRLADYYEKTGRFRKKIFHTLKYPAIVVTITMGVLCTLLFFFVPAAVRSILTYTGTLPTATKIALAAVTFVTDHRQSLLVSLVLFILILTFLWYTNVRLQWFEKIAWNIPLFGNFYRGNSLRRISFSLSFLLASGLSPSKALEMTAETVKDTRLRIKLRRAAQEKIGNNESLAAALKAAGGIFPSSILDTLSAIKEHRNGGEQFKKTAEYYEEEIEAAVNALVLVIEPLVVAITGLLGIGILLALYLPTLHIFGQACF
jgi:type IV pilus assembly protein PilC